MTVKPPKLKLQGPILLWALAANCVFQDGGNWTAHHICSSYSVRWTLFPWTGRVYVFPPLSLGRPVTTVVVMHVTSQAGS